MSAGLTCISVTNLRRRPVGVTTRTVVQAFDRQPFAELPTDDAAALERKLSVAFRLSRDRSAWLKPHQRIDVLHRLATLMEAKREHFARQIACEGGKPYTDAMVETHRAIDGVRRAAETLRTRGGREIPMGVTASSENRRAWTIHEPIGVVAAISAFNHPLKHAPQSSPVQST